MASALTHAFAAVALTKIVSAEKRDWRFWTVLAGSAVLPDADVIGFAFGIGYGDLLGHRGLSHSLLFAAAWSMTVVLWEYRQVTKGSKPWWTLLGLFFLATASHGALDAMTNGGLGIAFFSPFETTRYFLPWRPIQVSPIGVGRFFSGRGAAVIASEIIYVWLPISLIWICNWTLRKAVTRRSGT
ncbi:MAG TPA: metal-dependent hydrolase [Terriglobales bacterium]|nr:metal-dependent hydrolase [Terriglobales bacterium]